MVLIWRTVDINSQYNLDRKQVNKYNIERTENDSRKLAFKF